ncbi:hypothetical protein D5086_030456 [Populus alba]|uniref:Uncharacterized protein n=1 Tax=Populus alba TaxID=43335 RepID=A0ACC4ANL1_POPAL
MQQTRSSASCDNKGVSSGGSKAGTFASTKRAGSTPFVSNPPSSPLWPTTMPRGTSPQPSAFFSSFVGITFGSSQDRPVNPQIQAKETHPVG